MDDTQYQTLKKYFLRILLLLFGIVIGGIIAPTTHQLVTLLFLITVALAVVLWFLDRWFMWKRVQKNRASNLETLAKSANVVKNASSKTKNNSKNPKTVVNGSQGKDESAKNY